MVRRDPRVRKLFKIVGNRPADDYERAEREQRRQLARRREFEQVRKGEKDD